MTDKMIAKEYALNINEDLFQISIIQKKFKNIKSHLNQLVWILANNDYTSKKNSYNIRKCLDYGAIRQITILKDKNVLIEYSYLNYKSTMEYVINYKTIKNKIKTLKKENLEKDLIRIESYKTVLNFCEQEKEKVIYKDEKFFTKIKSQKDFIC